MLVDVAQLQSVDRILHSIVWFHVSILRIQRVLIQLHSSCSLESLRRCARSPLSGSQQSGGLHQLSACARSMSTKYTSPARFSWRQVHGPDMGIDWNIDWKAKNTKTEATKTPGERDQNFPGHWNQAPLGELTQREHIALAMLCKTQHMFAMPWIELQLFCKCVPMSARMI